MVMKYLALSLIALLASCESSQQIQPSKPGPLGLMEMLQASPIDKDVMERQRQLSAKPVQWNGAKWQRESFTSVKAYIYDYQADAFQVIAKNGRLHQGIINTDGVLLNPSQVEKLQDVYQKDSDGKIMAKCFLPHHAFVFFDAQDKIVAHLSVCFQCGTSSSSKKWKSNTYLSFKKVALLVKELGLPLSVEPPFSNKAWETKYREIKRLAKKKAAHPRG